MKQFVFEFDLGMDMNPTAGELIFSDDGMIKVKENGDERLSFHAKNIKEAIVKAGVGCGIVYITYEHKPEEILCRFTMSGLKPAGEFCKIVNFFVSSGIIAIPEEREKLICEKCGRPMVTGITVCLFCYSKLSVMKRAFGFLRPYAKRLITTQILNILGIIIALISPLFMRYLIDNHLYPRSGVLADVMIVAAAMLFTRIIADIVGVTGARIFNKATNYVANDLRVETYKKLQSHSMSLFAKRTPGDLIRRIMDDTGTVNEFITDLGRWIIEMVLVLVVVLTILFITNWQLTLLALLPVPIVVISVNRFWKYMRARFERHWRKGAKANSILHDIIKGIRTVKAFGNEKQEIEKFAAVNHELATIGMSNERVFAVMFPPLGFITGIGEFLILFFGGRMVLNPDIDFGLGNLVLFTMYLGWVYGPLRMLTNFPRWIAHTTTSMVKVFEILDDESEMTDPAEPKDVALAGGVEFAGVNFGYKSYEPVLKGIDLEIRPGETIGLVGKSGVGKSTLINLVMRLYDPNTGVIKINNTDLRDMSSTHLHENMGVVFQDTFLFAGTFYENIIYGKPDATYDEVIAAAKVANAHDFITQSPDGYETLIGEGGQTISGGERQRLSIARAIIKNPDLLILDEATSSLDVETEASIQESLNRITKDRTTIAIAHRLSTLRNADRLVVLDKGAVAEVGTHTELLKQRGIYYKLVMAQRQSSRKEEKK